MTRLHFSSRRHRPCAGSLFSFFNLPAPFFQIPLSQKIFARFFGMIDVRNETGNLAALTEKGNHHGQLFLRKVTTNTSVNTCGRQDCRPPTNGALHHDLHIHPRRSQKAQHCRVVCAIRLAPPLPRRPFSPAFHRYKGRHRVSLWTGSARNGRASQRLCLPRKTHTWSTLK